MVFRPVSSESPWCSSIYNATLTAVQLKELQIALNDHPRRNRLTGLQLSLSNLFDLLKYALTLAASTPSQFKWTAVVSWLAVLSGGISYAVYLRRVRGHLFHLDWLKKGH